MEDELAFDGRAVAMVTRLLPPVLIAGVLLITAVTENSKNINEVRFVKVKLHTKLEKEKQINN